MKPKPCKPGECEYHLVAIGNGWSGFNVWRCVKCGKEDWL